MVLIAYAYSRTLLSVLNTERYNLFLWCKRLLYIAFLYVLLQPDPLLAQYSARQYSSQCAMAVVSKNPESYFYSAIPSLHSYCKKPILFFSYTNRYLLSACSEKNVHFIYPNKYLTVGASVMYFGFPVYYEAKSTFNVSKSFQQRFFMGFNVNYYFSGGSKELRFPGLLSYDVAVSFPFASKFLYSMVVSDISHTPLAGKKRFLPVSMQHVLFFQLDKSFELSFSALTSNEYGLFAGMAMRYKPIPSVSVGIGWGGKPFMPGLCSSYHFKDFSVQLAFLYHPVLGMSPYSDVVIPF